MTFPLMFFLTGMEKKGENARLLFDTDRASIAFLNEM
jgi:hypothetical protein